MILNVFTVEYTSLKIQMIVGFGMERKINMDMEDRVFVIP
jgi:hypothetical protein